MPPRKRASQGEAMTSVAEDVSMTEVPAESAEEPVEEQDGDPAIHANDEQRIRVLGGSTDTAASFAFEKEDHTLGNALRYMIMKNPDVEFCGYSIPHPSEAVMNVRIQTYKGTAIEALEKGLTDLMDLCDIVAEKFVIARQDYDNRMDP